MEQSRNKSNAYLEGVVYKKTIGNYIVHSDGKVVSCSLSSRLQKELVFSSDNPNASRRMVRAVKNPAHYDAVVVGDRVQFLDAGNGTGMIVDVLPRRSKLARRSPVPMPTAHPFEQIIVANLDQVVPVFAAANPAPRWNLLDRYLVSAESSGLPALICMTKLDLLSKTESAELEKIAAEYRQIGYPVILTSAFTKMGFETLTQALQGRISVLVGKSGVGKSSLLNMLEPGLGLRVSEVSPVTGKGRHTTTCHEMFPLSFGGAIIDTPGVREFGLWEINNTDLTYFFPEMRLLMGKCRFGMDCQHDHEPGCAIRSAVSEGKISPRRYHSYLILKNETT